MDYSPLIRVVKDLIMRTPTSRLVLLWAIALSCILSWQAPAIIEAVAKLAK